jgi:hypothetical protein
MPEEGKPSGGDESRAIVVKKDLTVTDPGLVPQGWLYATVVAAIRSRSKTMKEKLASEQEGWLSGSLNSCCGFVTHAVEETVRR